jgi:hypothetical protein
MPRSALCCNEISIGETSYHSYVLVLESTYCNRRRYANSSSNVASLQHASRNRCSVKPSRKCTCKELDLLLIDEVQRARTPDVLLGCFKSLVSMLITVFRVLQVRALIDRVYLIYNP